MTVPTTRSSAGDAAMPNTLIGYRFSGSASSSIVALMSSRAPVSSTTRPVRQAASHSSSRCPCFHPRFQSFRHCSMRSLIAPASASRRASTAGCSCERRYNSRSVATMSSLMACIWQRSVLIALSPYAFALMASFTMLKMMPSRITASNVSAVDVATTPYSRGAFAVPPPLKIPLKRMTMLTATTTNTYLMMPSWRTVKWRPFSVSSSRMRCHARTFSATSTPMTGGEVTSNGAPRSIVMIWLGLMTSSQNRTASRRCFIASSAVTSR
mmetsp:Transcript_3528/g.12834  ORF Transcript_3528/g.12834 Transcript_3528/m.12834 type:complete len:268 (+) Transcript_3528:2379-3182(+)